MTARFPHVPPLRPPPFDRLRVRAAHASRWHVEDTPTHLPGLTLSLSKGEAGASAGAAP